MPEAPETLAFRPATPEDAAFGADVFTAVRPVDPVDPVAWRYEWEHPSDTWIESRFVATRAGARVGVAWFGHPRWDITPTRFAELGGDLLPAERGGLDRLLGEMERRAIADGATVLQAFAREDDGVRVRTILARGYREDRRARRWELDLVANRDRLAAMTAASRERMRREGVRLLTLAADADPKKYEKVWRLSVAAEADVPTTLPNIPGSLEDYLRWFRSPSVHEDRVWIARVGDEVVGVSLLGYPPVRGIVGTEWTATSRAVRGRGVARALKCETVMQAIALGIDRVRTGNDHKNDPILHINDTMGYRPIASGVQFLKDA